MGLTSTIKIEVDGKEVKDFVDLKISQNIYDHNEFEVRFRKETFEEGSLFLMDVSKDFIGSVIKIEIEDYKDNYKNTVPAFFFKGIITDVRATRSGLDEHNYIILSGHSPDIMLQDVPGCRTFPNMTLEAVVNRILSPMPKDLLRCNPHTSAGDSYEYLVQYNESSYDFLRRLATRYGQWFFYDGSELIFGTLNSNTIKLTLGMDLSDFGFSISVSPHNFKSKSYNSMDNNDQTRFVEASSNTEQSSKMLNQYGNIALNSSNRLFSQQSFFNNNHLGVPEKSYQKELPKAMGLMGSGIAAGMACGNGRSVNPKVKLGCKLDIKAFTEKTALDVDYGEYLVTSIVHFCDNLNNYSNSFECVPAKATIPDYTDPLAYPRCETQLGMVTDNKDPDKLGRVKVRLLWQTEGESTPWIRVAHPHAGKNSGFFFVPEVDEDVIVGFESGDAEKPIVMGSLYNGENAPSGGWASDKNDNKIIRTRSGNTIELIDKGGKEEINIYQENDKSGSHHISMITGSSPEMTIFSKGKLLIKAKGIEIDSAGAIKMTAGQGTKIKAGTDLSVESGTDMKVESGTEINLKAIVLNAEADGQFKAKAAIVMVEGSATTTIKGGMVMLNP